MTRHRRKSWASWFPIERGDVTLVMTGDQICVYERARWESYAAQSNVAKNRKHWGMKP